MLLSLPLLALLLVRPCRAFVAHYDPSPSFGRVGIRATTRDIPMKKKQPQRSTILAAQQLLEFVEPTTGVTVKLVGAMHYNPTSIRLAQDTIRDLAAQDKLGSIVIESCDLRWNNTLQHEPLLQKILFSEMRAAHDLGLAYQRPVVLGDQRFNITVKQLKFGLVETVKDLVNPVTGWSSIWSNITAARKEAMPFADGQNLGVAALVDPKLLLGFPVSLIKYPFSYVAKSPVAALVLFGLLFVGEDATAAAINADPMSTTDWVGNLVGAGLEIILFARIFLKELLAERNEILARNILEQCRFYQAKGGDRQSAGASAFSLVGLLPSVFRRGPLSTTATAPTTQAGMAKVVYAPDSVPPRYEGDNEKVVVAVLGMAHCNGIMRLLKEQRVN